jgi:L-Ala-D/L-Glu epimerase
MRLVDVQLYQVKIPLKLKVEHAAQAYDKTSNLVARMILRGKKDYVGYGECVPRMHVTKENLVIAEKRAAELAGQIKRFDFKGFKDVEKALDKCCTVHTSARCAVELALFDAVGKATNKYVGEYIGRRKKRSVCYSGVIPYMGMAETSALAYRMRNFRDIKVKVGFNDDIQRISMIRKTVGSRPELIADANQGWTVKKAAEMISQLSGLGITSIEQPLDKKNVSGYQRLKGLVSLPMTADESLCSLDDARRLCKEKLFGMFDIRLSKCGGIVNSIRIAELARKSSINLQLGCHVGETGILSAAGRALAFHYGHFRYHEGSFGRYLLKEDLVKEDVSFNQEGIAYPIKGVGLGITVDENLLKAYS